MAVKKLKILLLIHVYNNVISWEKILLANSIPKSSDFAHFYVFSFFQFFYFLQIDVHVVDAIKELMWVYLVTILYQN